MVECLATLVWNLAHSTSPLTVDETNHVYLHGVSSVRVLAVLSAHGQYISIRL